MTPHYGSNAEGGHWVVGSEQKEETCLAFADSFSPGRRLAEQPSTCVLEPGDSICLLTNEALSRVPMPVTRMKTVTSETVKHIAQLLACRKTQQMAVWLTSWSKFWELSRWRKMGCLPSSAWLWGRTE